MHWSIVNFNIPHTAIPPPSLAFELLRISYFKFPPLPATKVSSNSLPKCWSCQSKTLFWKCLNREEKRHGVWPFIKTVTFHDTAVASHTDGFLEVWEQIDFFYLLYKMQISNFCLTRNNYQDHSNMFLVLLLWSWFIILLF